MNDTGLWVIGADGADIDEAYDAAVAEAADTFGASHPLLEVTPDAMDLSYHDGLVAVGAGGTRTSTGALRAAPTAARSASTVVALPYSADRFWARRRINVKIDDAALELGVDGTIGEPRTLDVDDELLAALCGLAADDAALRDGELIDAVTLLRLRCRYKTVVTKGEGKGARKYVARADSGVVLGEGRTASEARRAAVAAMKDSLDGVERYGAEVYVETRRESGPHLRLERVRIAQRGAVRIAVAAEKDPARTKVAGWVFAGMSAMGANDDGATGDAETNVDATGDAEVEVTVES